MPGLYGTPGNNNARTWLSDRNYVVGESAAAGSPNAQKIKWAEIARLAGITDFQGAKKDPRFRDLQDSFYGHSNVYKDAIQRALEVDPRFGTPTPPSLPTDRDPNAPQAGTQIQLPGVTPGSLGTPLTANNRPLTPPVTPPGTPTPIGGVTPTVRPKPLPPQSPPNPAPVNPSGGGGMTGGGGGMTTGSFGSPSMSPMNPGPQMPSPNQPKLKRAWGY